MIQVNIRCNDDEIVLTMEGHANYSDGNDIVCAAASAIAYSWLGFLDNYCYDYTSEVDSGHLYVRCKNNKEMNIAFAVTYIGLSQLEKKYKNCIKINEFVA